MTLLVGLSCFGAFLSLFFFGFHVYEETEELEWAVPVWLMSAGFGWQTFELIMLPLTPWRRE